MTDPSQRRPVTATGAAAIGIVCGALGTFLYMLAALGAFAAGVPISGLIAIAITAVFLAWLVGGLRTVQGRSPRLLMRASYIVMGLGVVALVVTLMTSQGVSLVAILAIVLPGAVVFLLRQPPTREYFASRGVSY
jgi:hypothetical protein